MTGKKREQEYCTSLRMPKTWEAVIKDHAKKWRCTPAYVIRCCIFSHLIVKSEQDLLSWIQAKRRSPSTLFHLAYVGIGPHAATFVERGFNNSIETTTSESYCRWNHYQYDRLKLLPFQTYYLVGYHGRISMAKIQVSLQLSISQFKIITDHITSHIPINEKLVGRLYSAKVFNQVVDVRCSMKQLEKIAVAIESTITRDVLHWHNSETLAELENLEKELWMPLLIVRTINFH